VRNWPTVTACYLGFAQTYPVRFRTRSGLVAHLDTYHDLVTAWVVFCRDEYHTPSDAELIVDVGANIGLFTLYAAATAPRANIVAVEPYPACFRRLSAAVAENRLDARVACWQLAVAGAAGNRFMIDLVDVTQSNGLLPPRIDVPSGSIAVEAVTLPDLLARVRARAGERPIDLLKIDVEGAEHEFLTGLRPGELEGVTRVAMEYHPNGDKATLFASLANQGLPCVHDLSFGANVGVALFRRKGDQPALSTVECGGDQGRAVGPDRGAMPTGYGRAERAEPGVGATRKL
jgi:FkbM family methyltransferase